MTELIIALAAVCSIHTGTRATRGAQNLQKDCVGTILSCMAKTPGNKLDTESDQFLSMSKCLKKR